MAKEKPAQILQHEFAEKLVAIINESQLPAFVLIPVVEQALGNLRTIEQEQYKSALAEYESVEEE